MQESPEWNEMITIAIAWQHHCRALSSHEAKDVAQILGKLSKKQTQSTILQAATLNRLAKRDTKRTIPTTRVDKTETHQNCSKTHPRALENDHNAQNSSISPG